LIPGIPLGLLTNAVQALAGILLPSAAVFLLLLCNDKQVLGPWVNGRSTNLLTVIIVGLLVVLSIVLTAAVVFPDLSAASFLNIIVGSTVIAVIIGIVSTALRIYRTTGEIAIAPKPTRAQLDNWRMPPLETLAPNSMSNGTKIWMGILRGYLIIAALMVAYKVILLAM